MEEHLKAQLEPFCALDSQQIHYSGPSLTLLPAATQALGLAFHELATNAAKHGALKKSGGRISVTWHVRRNADKRIFNLMWEERFESSEPVRANGNGFGSTVLNRVVPEAISGKVTYRMSNSGIIWEVEAPLDEVEAQLRQDAPSVDRKAAPKGDSAGA